MNCATSTSVTGPVRIEAMRTMSAVRRSRSASRSSFRYTIASGTAAELLVQSGCGNLEDAFVQLAHLDAEGVA